MDVKLTKQQARDFLVQAHLLNQPKLKPGRSSITGCRSQATPNAAHSEFVTGCRSQATPNAAHSEFVARSLWTNDNPTAILSRVLFSSGTACPSQA
jgi:hypothetical protein